MDDRTSIQVPETTAQTLYVKVYYYGGGTGTTNGKYSLVTTW